MAGTLTNAQWYRLMATDSQIEAMVKQRDELLEWKRGQAAHDEELIKAMLACAAEVRVPNSFSGGTNGLDVAQKEAILALTPADVAAYQASQKGRKC